MVGQRHQRGPGGAGNVQLAQQGIGGPGSRGIRGRSGAGAVARVVHGQVVDEDQVRPGAPGLQRLSREVVAGLHHG